MMNDTASEILIPQMPPATPKYRAAGIPTSREVMRLCYRR